MRYLNHIKTPNSYIIMFDSGNPVTVLKKDGKTYDRITKALSEEDYDKIPEIASVGTFIQKKSDGKVKIENGKAIVGGRELPLHLASRIISMVKSKADVSVLLAFWDRLKSNPSKTSQEELYGFIEKNHVPITPDGHFIAYKSVDKDFLDSYTHTFDNTPGQIVSMPRDQVNPDRNKTCSHGLHVAAFRYAKHVYRGDIMLEVDVDPKDVVSVPIDYDRQKMRVCKYKVLRVYKGAVEIKDEIVEPKVKPVSSFEFSIKTKYIRVTKSMLSLIPKPKDGDIVPLYVCVKDSKCGFVAILKKPYAKCLYCKEYESTSSVNVTEEAMKAANMKNKSEFKVEKAKNGILIKAK